MSFSTAIKSVFSQYVGFSGRARRSEYWWFALFTILVSIVTAILDSALGLTFVEGSTTGFIGLIASLALLLPSLAVAVRRLHDTDRTGWWLLIALVPFVGAIVLLVFFVLDSTPGANRFGPNPKG
ncbi:uncharacterized membrane protein YhaH (DUF805 family) [Micromonospora vinacea]|uniref:Uncharacterized membrane protein YhaH (DUF805 family) n=1 Tax=Micromonospora vinacea TaxID=709878 RepID=A0ABS0JVW5_9ACTN|nr:DUF805 domain-containing protein [Micromonospora vinacea]MBG6100503.1 uncharacterized membrane protein YhaH (DUF805 family) [Micromonospora vinacea]WTA66949.1 DUF805 domain-containing protein [Micromonospora sp. NBC_00855]